MKQTGTEWLFGPLPHTPVHEGMVGIQTLMVWPKAKVLYPAPNAAFENPQGKNFFST